MEDIQHDWRTSFITDSDAAKTSVDEITGRKDEIPYLDQLPSYDSLKAGTLIRFKCMIQDNPDKVLKHKKAGDFDLKYRREFEGVPPSTPLSHDFYDVERFVAVSIPGVTLEKPLVVDLVAAYYDPSMHKRTVAPVLARIAECEDGQEPPAMVPADEGCEAEGPEFPRSTSAHPLPASMVDSETAERRVSAMLNICDSDLTLKLHDTVEVIGVLNYADGTEGPAVDFSIEVIDIKPVSLVSRPESKLTTEQIEVARATLKTVLGRLLKGDELAAEYLLLELISNRVHGSEAVPTLGSWALNINNADDVDNTLLAKFIRACSEGPSVSFKADNETLMTEKFYPYRPIEADYINPGALQLPNGSTVVIDERGLKEGNVNALNILAINKAVREQELIGIFGQSDIVNFKIDSRFILINAGSSKSLFGNANPSYGVIGSSPFVNVTLQPQACAVLSESDICLSEQDLDLARNYIAHARNIAKDVKIAEDVIEGFQNAWVDARKADSTIPVDDLEIWATLLRSVAASRGLTETSSEVLSQVLEIEEARRSRAPKQGKPDVKDRCDEVSIVTGA